MSLHFGQAPVSQPVYMWVLSARMVEVSAEPTCAFFPSIARPVPSTEHPTNHVTLIQILQAKRDELSVLLLLVSDSPTQALISSRALCNMQRTHHRRSTILNSIARAAQSVLRRGTNPLHTQMVSQMLHSATLYIYSTKHSRSSSKPRKTLERNTLQRKP